jgi:hypothetical protein
MRCGPSLKKQKNVDEGDGDADRQGDCWKYIAMKADTKLHLAHRICKRVQATADVNGKKTRQEANGGWEGHIY